ncbi:MAG: hypothetical protein ACRD0N_00665 [Acidimicrobiales bacterium]
MSTAGLHRPPAWDLLAEAITQRRCVEADYHGHARLLCPHLLGWKHGRARVLSYQAAGSTSRGSLSADRRQRWRWMFVDEIDGATMTDDPWQSADNYRPGGTGVETIAVAVNG